MPRITTLTVAAFLLALPACDSTPPRATPAPAATSDPVAAADPLPTPLIDPGPYRPDATDDQLLDHIQRTTALYFIENADPETAMISDRAAAYGGKPGDVASVGAQGFAYSVWCLAAERGWIPRDLARERTLTSLRFLLNRVESKEGFFYHFVDRQNGRRDYGSEISSIDTALALAGAITARAYFDQATPDEVEIRDLVTQLYAAVNWPWMTDGGETLRLGWTPEHGFLPERWDSYSELMVMQLLAMASPHPEHALPPSSWHAWNRVPIITFGGRTFLACPPLFTHQYSQAWFDFKDKHDDYADYYHNSQLATLAQRQMVIDFSVDFPHYSEKLWGLTASDGPTEYFAWGGPPALVKPPLDGIVVPCAPGGSVPFAPEKTIEVLRNLRENHAAETWTRYGFIDAFNPGTGWVSHDVLAIDAGITVMAIENHRTGFFWDLFMSDPAAQRAFKLANFQTNAPDRATTHRRHLTEHPRSASARPSPHAVPHRRRRPSRTGTPLHRSRHRPRRRNRHGTRRRPHGAPRHRARFRLHLGHRSALLRRPRPRRRAPQRLFPRAALQRRLHRIVHRPARRRFALDEPPGLPIRFCPRHLHPRPRSPGQIPRMVRQRPPRP